GRRRSSECHSGHEFGRADEPRRSHTRSVPCFLRWEPPRNGRPAKKWDTRIYPSGGRVALATGEPSGPCLAPTERAPSRRGAPHSLVNRRAFVRMPCSCSSTRGTAPRGSALSLGELLRAVGRGGPPSGKPCSFRTPPVSSDCREWCSRI